MSLVPANSILTALPSNLFKVISYTNASAVTNIAAGAAKEIALTTSDDFSGYTPIGIVYLDCGNAKLGVSFMHGQNFSNGKNIDFVNGSDSAIESVAAGAIKLRIMGVKMSS